MLLPLLIAAALTPLPPPPVVAERPMIAWIADTATCNGTPVAPTAMRRPFVSLGWTDTIRAEPLILRFRIDAEGRPLSIAQAPDTPGTYTNRPSPSDVAPSLAASRFAAGTPREGCEISYRLRVTPLAETPVEDLISYTLAPDAGTLPKPGWDRIMPADGTCANEPRPQPLVRVLPDFAKLAGTPGAREWTMIGYDTDAGGRPIAVRIPYGTHNRVLDAAAVKAMKESRFTEGARTGCLYPYYRNPEIMPAPAMADPAATPQGQCPGGQAAWATPPRLIYPEPFRRRSIEGWAIVGFDVAPWGEVGNVRVLAAEPAAAFGEQAMQMLRTARKAASQTGSTGCVERIRFAMGRPGDTLPPDAASDAPPPF
ncbi:TonB family protein [Sphingomonas sp. 1P08PE]|uniref:TonB family protein n=1 Tax=Sphingomonas sp. 1P08PE TaxID=554122 RepID=UPI0039A18023